MLTIKKLAFFSIVGLFSGQAYAHTTVRDVAIESTASYNAFNIGHGCAGDTGTEQYPVVGQSALFPYGANAIWRDASGNVIAQGGNGNGTIASASLSLAVAGYAGSSLVYPVTSEIVDSLGVVHALLWKGGALEPKLNTLTQFKITAPTIANNCVKSLKIRIGVINWCDTQKNAANDKQGPYLAPHDAQGKLVPRIANTGVQTNVGNSYFSTMWLGNGDNNRADWWFPAPYGGSALYNDADMLQVANSWAPTLTVTNSDADLAKCTGAKVDVSVEPSAADFDAYLNGPNTQPFTKGSTNF